MKRNRKPWMKGKLGLGYSEFEAVDATLITERSVNISVLLLARVFLKLESRFLSC